MTNCFRIQTGGMTYNYVFGTQEEAKQANDGCIIQEYPDIKPFWQKLAQAVEDENENFWKICLFEPEGGGECMVFIPLIKKKFYELNNLKNRL